MEKLNSTTTAQPKADVKEVVIGFNAEERSDLTEHIEHLSYKLQNLKDMLDVLAIYLDQDSESMIANAVSAGSDSLEMILDTHIEPIKTYFFASAEAEQK
jgi:hypothetical protein